MTRMLLVIILIMISLMITGCWDRRELQDRNFVMAAAIDTVEAGSESSDAKNPGARQVETFTQPNGEKRYRLTLQLLKITQSSGGDSGGSKESGGKTYTISNTGQSMFEMVRDMGGQSSKTIWFEHIQTIVLSEAVVKRDGVRPLLDFFLRDGEMRSRIKVFVTPGEARELLEFQPPTGEPGGIYFANIARNHPKNVHVAAAQTDIGYISQAMDSDSDVLIPQMTKAGNVVRVGGAAAFKKDRFVGYLDDYAVMGLKLLRGTEKSAIITARVPGDPEATIQFEVFHHDTRLRPHVEGGRVYFTLDIVMEGNVGEYQFYHGKRVYDNDNPEQLHELERIFAEEVKRSVLYTLQTEQQMGTDHLGFNLKIKAHLPDVWEEIKGNWDEIFPTIPMLVSVNVIIRNVGEHR